jgi:hypothetical protein
VRVLLSAATSPANGPVHVVASSRREPVSDAMISWHAVAVTRQAAHPGELRPLLEFGELPGERRQAGLPEPRPAARLKRPGEDRLWVSHGRDRHS